MTEAETISRRLLALAGVVAKVRHTGALLEASDVQVLHAELEACGHAVFGIGASATQVLPPRLVIEPAAGVTWEICVNHVLPR